MPMAHDYPSYLLAPFLTLQQTRDWQIEQTALGVLDFQAELVMPHGALKMDLKDLRAQVGTVIVLVTRRTTDRAQ